MSKQCNCTYMYPRCPIGIELEGKSMQAHIALQNATPENMAELHKVFSEAVIAYMQHVDISTSVQLINAAMKGE